MQNCQYFSYFSIKTCVVGTHWKHLSVALLMSTHNICCHREIRKLLSGYLVVSYLELCIYVEFF